MAKAKVRGICKLCLMEGELQKSHLIPRAVYALCRATVAPNPNPLMVTHQLAMQTSRQTQHHLLCFRCEQLLREKGEDWVIPQLAVYGGAFSLGSALAASVPHIHEPDFDAYLLGTIPTIRVHDLVHFAMGIFWKASAHSWLKGRNKPWIDLGTYAEETRRFVLGIGPFPKDMALSLLALPMPVGLVSFYLPFETLPPSDGRTYHLYISGLQYTLWTGPDIPFVIRVGALQAPPHLAIVTDASESIVKRFKEAFATATKSKKLPKPWNSGAAS